MFLFELFLRLCSPQFLLLGIVLYALYFLLHPYVFSPLQKIRGPWYAIYTKWWLVRITTRGIRSKTIHELHQQYGPWVRIAPNEISTCDPEALAPIYGVGSEHVKTDFYTYQNRGIPEIFNMSDRNQHARRRRELSHLFSMSTITEYEPVIAIHVRTCMDAIACEGRNHETSNLYEWWHYLSMDIICDLAFGTTFDMLHEGTSNAYIKDLYGSFQIEPIRWHFGWLNRFALYAPLKFIRDAEKCSIRVMDRGAEMVQNYIHNPVKTRRKDLLQKMLDVRDDEGKPLSIAALNIEAGAFILAGSHTTSSSLTWIVWRIIRDRDNHILQRLRQELDSALAGLPRDAIAPHSRIEHLPYFNCVIKEGLRIDTAAPGSLPRYVPSGGCTIKGNVLPGGCIVSAQAYSCHRDEAVFPDANAFKPERWMDGNETTAMRRLYVPFGVDGPRKCMGMHLANMELRVILASLFWRFDLRLGKGASEESMEMDENFLAIPMGQRLDVVATERS